MLGPLGGEASGPVAEKQPGRLLVRGQGRDEPGTQTRVQGGHLGDPQATRRARSIPASRSGGMEMILSHIRSFTCSPRALK